MSDSVQWPIPAWMSGRVRLTLPSHRAAAGFYSRTQKENLRFDETLLFT